ncbi:MAG: lysylphosphatidylglycerol synthase transmembrane domain-containing protein [Legionellales bacterium]
MKKYIGSIIKLVVSLGIGVALVFWFVGQMSPSDKQNVIDDVKRANYVWVIIPPLIGLISNYFRTQRWRILLRSLGYNPAFLNTFLSVMIMYFLNLFFPRLGEVSRCGVLSRYEKIPLDKAIGTMVLERVMDLVCIGIVSLLLLVE